MPDVAYRIHEPAALGCRHTENKKLFQIMHQITSIEL